MDITRLIKLISELKSYRQEGVISIDPDGFIGHVHLMPDSFKERFKTFESVDTHDDEFPYRVSVTRNDLVFYTLLTSTEYEELKGYVGNNGQATD